MADFNVTALLETTKRDSDDYVNATVWCQKFGKLWNEFQRLPASQKYIKATCEKLDAGKSRIIETKRGKNSVTFVHPLVAIELARWLSPEFSLITT